MSLATAVERTFVFEADSESSELLSDIFTHIRLLVEAGVGFTIKGVVLGRTLLNETFSLGDTETPTPEEIYEVVEQAITSADNNFQTLVISFF